MNLSSPYHPSLSQSISRVFTLLDQNAHSPTFGCFDRSYWHYKMVTDIPSIAYQQLTLALTLFYKNESQFSTPHTKENLLVLIMNTILFWTKHQHREGCFDEWYRNERSFCVTAFSTYAMTESLLMLKEELDPKFIAQITPHLQKAGYWLTKNKNDYVTNQMAMSILALHNLHHLLKDPFFQTAYEQRKKHVLFLQQEEGWFPEYGGPDIGYLSLTLDALAKDYKKTKDEKVLEALQKGYSFIQHFFNPDGSIGGEYGSRNSQYFFPYGLEILKNILPEAHTCLEQFYTSLQNNKIPTPSSVDDRYFAYFFMPNFLQAHLEYIEDTASSPKQKKEPYEVFFPKAKLLVLKNKNYSVIAEGNKCGILKIYKDTQLIYSDCGTWAKTPSHLLTNQAFKNTACTYSPHSLTFTIEGYFTKFSHINPLDQYPILFRLLNKTIQSSALFSVWCNDWIKKFFILKPKPRGLKFKKEIIFKDDQILIKEVILSSLKHTLIAFEPLSLAITPYSPTSHLKDVTLPLKDLPISHKICTLLNIQKRVNIIRTISIPKGPINITVT